MFGRHFGRRFGRRYGRKVFPFWIFFILFFVFAGKSGLWMWVFPFFLIWMFGPMFWSFSSGGRKWEHEREVDSSRNPIPPAWQAPSPTPRTVHPPAQPMRSTAGLPTTCPACGGPINPTTLEWRTQTPHCGYCGTNLK
jgi:hypothetical protein